MPLRKGQFIITYLVQNLKIPTERHSVALAQMSDEQFAEIEYYWALYASNAIHDGREWKDFWRYVHSLKKDLKKKSNGKGVKHKK